MSKSAYCRVFAIIYMGFISCFLNEWMITRSGLATTLCVCYGTLLKEIIMPIWWYQREYRGHAAMFLHIMICIPLLACVPSSLTPRHRRIVYHALIVFPMLFVFTFVWPVATGTKRWFVKKENIIVSVYDTQARKIDIIAKHLTHLNGSYEVWICLNKFQTHMIDPYLKQSQIIRPGDLVLARTMFNVIWSTPNDDLRSITFLGHIPDILGGAQSPCYLIVDETVENEDLRDLTMTLPQHHVKKLFVLWKHETKYDKSDYLYEFVNEAINTYKCRLLVLHSLKAVSADVSRLISERL